MMNPKCQRFGKYIVILSLFLILCSFSVGFGVNQISPVILLPSVIPQSATDGPTSFNITLCNEDFVGDVFSESNTNWSQSTSGTASVSSGSSSLILTGTGKIGNSAQASAEYKFPISSFTNAQLNITMSIAFWAFDLHNILPYGNWSTDGNNWNTLSGLYTSAFLPQRQF